MKYYIIKDILHRHDSEGFIDTLSESLFVCKKEDERIIMALGVDYTLEWDVIDNIYEYLFNKLADKGRLATIDTLKFTICEIDVQQ